MKKIWGYIIAALSGIIIGIILWEKINSPTTLYKGRIKLKQRGEGNQMDSSVILTIQQAREKKRELKKAAREEKRAERKENK